METNQILDAEIVGETSETGTEIEIISLTKFIILSIISFGMYELWWIYKSWRFFKEKDSLDIYPVARTLFSIFFLHSLFTKVKDYALSYDWRKDYPTAGLVIGFVVFNFLSRLPDPFWMISCISFIFFIQPFEAFNYAISNSEEYSAVERSGFNGRQIGILVVGGILWAMVFYGLFIPLEEY